MAVDNTPDTRPVQPAPRTAGSRAGDAAAPRRAHHQGRLALVLIASAGGLAGGLAGCGADPNDTPVEVSRAVYTQIEDCVQDWGSEADCEFDPSGMDNAPGAGAPPGQASSAAGSGHSTAHSTHYNGSGIRWMGPWFSRSGTVYRYDGRVEALQRLPSRNTGMDTWTQSANEIYANTKGRYATTAAHPQASPAKSARSAQSASGRGGFGGTGRLFSSSGG